MELGTTTDYIFYWLIQRSGSLCHKKNNNNNSGNINYTPFTGRISKALESRQGDIDEDC